MTLIDKVARALFEDAEPGLNWDDMTTVCREGYSVSARAAIAVVLKELYRKGSWLHLDRTLDLVQEIARENGVSLDDPD